MHKHRRTHCFGIDCWQRHLDHGKLASIGSPNTATTSLTGIPTGTSNFIWTVTNGVCPSSTAAVTVVKDAVPSAANAGTGFSICTSTVQLNATPVTTGTGTWTTIQGLAQVASSLAATSSVTAVGTGTNVFLWTVGNGVCPTVTSAITIVRDALPTPANAGSNQTICTSTAVLTASALTVGNGTWTTVSLASIASPNTATTSLTGIPTGTSNFIWTVTNGVCPSSTAAVTVVKDAVPSAANAGSDFSVCTSTVQLNATPVTTGTGTWTTIQGLAQVANSLVATSSVTAVGTGTNIFLWTVGNGVCPTVTSAITIVRDALPTPANAGTNQTICTSTAVLTASALTVGNGTWTR